MSEFVWEPCACGVDIVSVSPDEDDVRVAVAVHNEQPCHQEWRAVQSLKEWRRPKGPCICRGGEKSNARAISLAPDQDPSYHEQTGTSGAHVDSRADAVPQLVPVGAASLRHRQVLDA